MKKGDYTEAETEKFLKKYLPVAKNKFCTTSDEVIKVSRKIGFPLVLKIISKEALHKSDIGGVRFVNKLGDLENELESLKKIAQHYKLKLEGILVQEYIEGEYAIIGLKKDNVFGHVVAFGIGGIYTEYLKDVVFRVCPITKKDAQDMIDELKMKQVFLGARGKKPVNLEFLKDIIVKVSKIPQKHKEIQEMDINPFVINHKTGMVVDARMRI